MGHWESEGLALVVLAAKGKCPECVSLTVVMPWKFLGVEVRRAGSWSCVSINQLSWAGCQASASSSVDKRVGQGELWRPFCPLQIFFSMWCDVASVKVIQALPALGVPVQSHLCPSSKQVPRLQDMPSFTTKTENLLYLKRWSINVQLFSSALRKVRGQMSLISGTSEAVKWIHLFWNN